MTGDDRGVGAGDDDRDGDGTGPADPDDGRTGPADPDDGRTGPADSDGDDAALDPVALEVLRNACAAVAEEMNATLVRTAYSPNVTDRLDCSCAVFDPDGDLLSQAENIPVHLGAMPFSVAAALEAHPPETLAPGDAIALNDPFRGGAHLPDVTLVTPVFAPTDAERGDGDESDPGGAGDVGSGDERGVDPGDGDDDGGTERRAEPEREVVAVVANRAHHADVGGASAGSVGADATEIYEEGLRLPPVQLVGGGELDDDLLDVVLANVRTPEERRGDLRAQVAANEVGRQRVRELVAERGVERFAAATDAIQDYAERRARAAIAELPDGSATFADVLDGDGQGTEDVRIEATLSVDGDSLAVDFEGSAPQTASPLNAVRAVTVSATYFAVRCATDPDVPANAGAYRPIEVATPSGSVVDAEPPAAVVGGNLEVAQRVADVVFGALGELAPDRAVAAGQGTMNNVTIGGTDPRPSRSRAGNAGDARDASFAFYETQAGGAGARAGGTGAPAGSPDAGTGSAGAGNGDAGDRFGGDGLDGVHVHMTNTRNTAAEVLQTAYPLAVERYELRPDSGGAGEFRGGLGLRRDLRVRTDDATLHLLADRRRHAPYGLAGGEDGATGEDVLLRDGRAIELPGKCSRDLRRGDVVSVRTPGGGGYGAPGAREASAVLRDVRLGKVSAEAARDAYDVAVDGRDVEGRDVDGRDVDGRGGDA